VPPAPHQEQKRLALITAAAKDQLPVATTLPKIADDPNLSMQPKLCVRSAMTLRIASKVQIEVLERIYAFFHAIFETDQSRPTDRRLACARRGLPVPQHHADLGTPFA